MRHDQPRNSYDDIEAELRRDPGVVDCVVTDVPTGPDEHALVAYVVTSGGIEAGDLLARLAGSPLPTDRIPQAVLPVDAVPRAPGVPSTSPGCHSRCYPVPNRAVRNRTPVRWKAGPEPSPSCSPRRSSVSSRC
jgi:hypothetical protein